MSNSGNEISNSTNPGAAAQLADARLKQWHQQGEALLTAENLRAWINAAGLVLFAPRPQIASPAPTLVEAVLGAPAPQPTLAQIGEARSLLARLVAEGVAVPLNLLGTGVAGGPASNAPDFVASTAVFSYIFTLRGDKAWKQPPSNTGPIKVSNLAVAIHEALSRRGALSAYDLTTEVGKEVTEAAVLRALVELWGHLRVLPLDQPDGSATLWELASTRFTKQIKAGANAGQPSALSALISLYLAQAVVAAEDEIESFLSPLAPRSRVRDVVHALLAARELETLAVEGRTMLHVAGMPPAFVAAAVAQDSDSPEEMEVEAGGDAENFASSEAAPRIKKFVPKPRKVGTGFLAKAKPSQFASRPDSGPKAGGFRPKPGFKPGFKGRKEGAPWSGPAAGAERERRPFNRPAGGGFDKPWDEEKQRRLSAARKPSNPRDEAQDKGDSSAPRRPRPEGGYKPRTDGERGRSGFGSKPPFRAKRGFDGKPAYGAKPGFSAEGRPPRRDFPKRSEGEGSDRRPPRREFKPRDGEARRTGPRPDRQERGTFDRPRGDRKFAPRLQDERPRREQSAQPRDEQQGKRPYRKFDAPRPRQDRAGFPERRPRRTDGSGDAGRPIGDFPPRKPRPDAAGKSRGFEKKGGKPGGFGGRKFSGKPSDKPFSGKPGNTFSKFAGNKKPFGKRPPARKYKPGKDESA